MPVVFYHMEGCGFCEKAKDELVDEIASGKVIIKDSKEAPAGVRGFPHFVNEDNGKTVTGFKPAALLMKELGVVGAGPMPSTRRPMPPKPPTPAGMPMPPKPMMPRGSPMPKMGGMPMAIVFSSCPVVASAKNVRRCLLMKFLKVLSNSCPTPRRQNTFVVSPTLLDQMA